LGGESIKELEFNCFIENGGDGRNLSANLRNGLQSGLSQPPTGKSTTGGLSERLQR
jgi:hypothetical protein